MSTPDPEATLALANEHRQGAVEHLNHAREKIDMVFLETETQKQLSHLEVAMQSLAFGREQLKQCERLEHAASIQADLMKTTDKPA